jgi:hypothetical protein
MPRPRWSCFLVKPDTLLNGAVSAGRRAEGKWRETPADAWPEFRTHVVSGAVPMSDLPFAGVEAHRQSEPPTLGSGRLPQLAGSSLTCYRWHR